MDTYNSLYSLKALVIKFKKGPTKGYLFMYCYGLNVASGQK